jgi:hypothetical protein
MTNHDQYSDAGWYLNALARRQMHTTVIKGNVEPPAHLYSGTTAAGRRRCPLKTTGANATGPNPSGTTQTPRILARALYDLNHASIDPVNKALTTDEKEQ